MFICLSHNKLEDKTDNLNLEFYYNITLGELDTQFNFEEIKQFEKPYKKAQINLIKSEMGHLDTQEYDLAVPDMDLELNYGSDFIKIHDVIVDRLNKPNDKGIILLHGDPGTGKTTVIAEIIWQTLLKEPDAKLLITSQTNLAVDNALELAAAPVPAIATPVTPDKAPPVKVTLSTITVPLVEAIVKLVVPL
jgi:hypothetical protein